MNPGKSARAYHHGDLRNALVAAAREIVEKEGIAGLSLRSVARRAGVSHAAPYRHFANHETLLAELAVQGFRELKEELADAADAPGLVSERVANIGAAYMRFAARRSGLARLMFGPQLPNRAEFPELAAATDEIGDEIGRALNDTALGLAVWAAVHGLAMLILENVIDLGQRQAGPEVLPARAKILLRTLFSRDP